MGLIAFFEGASKYAKAHERLIVIVLAAILVWGVSGKIEGLIANHDKKQLDAAQATLQAQVQANATIAANNKEQEARYQALAQTYAQQNAALEQQALSAIASAKRQQQTDVTLAPPALAARIQALANLPDNSIGVAPNGYTVTSSGAVQIAQALEMIPPLQVQLKTAETEKTHDEELLAQANTTIAGKTNEIAGLNKQIVDADKVCADKLAVEKDNTRKARRRGFIFGFISGFLARQFLPKL